jgi:hypothetical protein
MLKQQWKIEEISIFSNSSHLEWRAGLSDIILKGTHPRTIPARFGLIWFSGCGEKEKLNCHKKLPGFDFFLRDLIFSSPCHVSFCHNLGSVVR